MLLRSGSRRDYEPTPSAPSDGPAGAIEGHIAEHPPTYRRFRFLALLVVALLACGAVLAFAFLLGKAHGQSSIGFLNGGVATTNDLGGVEVALALQERARKGSREYGSENLTSALQRKLPSGPTVQISGVSSNSSQTWAKLKHLGVDSANKAVFMGYSLSTTSFTAHASIPPTTTAKSTEGVAVSSTATEVPPSATSTVSPTVTPLGGGVGTPNAVTAATDPSSTTTVTVTSLADTTTTVSSSTVLTTTRSSTSTATSVTTTPGTTTSTKRYHCLGFDVCPEYPRPYAFNEWPTSYSMEGSFPAGFAWGLGTAAYQIEGGYREGGRGASIWDTFTGANTVGMPGGDCSYCCKVAPCPVSEHMIAKGATGNVACDHYHTWRSDIALMQSMGLKHYRFSIAWSRMVPTGKVMEGAGINQEAVKFYNSLIDGLLAADITPYVTLYHWDLPQALLSPPEVQGWWSSDPDTGEPNGQILQDWLDYADACFAAFGDRVKMWMTFNEAWTFTWLGSGWGKAPSITPFNDMNYHPWIAAHNVLNAHAEAVALYRRKYQDKQGGKIGITNNCDWREPASQSPYDIAAAERAVLWSLAWFTDPIFGGHGDYPEVMRRMLGAKLPKFTEEQKKLINGSADFFGLNHYGSGFAETAPDAPGFDGARVKISEKGFSNAQSSWLFSAPWGFRKLLNWVDKRYNHPVIYVTENGWSLNAETADEGKADRERLEFYANYTSEMRKAIVEDGVDVQGYFAWSLLDNFEWDQGYVERFGTTYVDFAYGNDENSPEGSASKPTEGFQTRTRKDSSCWLEALWRRNALVSPARENFTGCAPSSAFTGFFIDVAHPSCWREILVDASGKEGKIWGIDGNTSAHCDGITDVSWVLQASFSGGTMIVDLSSSGGPAHLLGYWDSADQSVRWGDGKTWSKQAVPVYKNFSGISINIFEERSASNATARTAGSEAGNQDLIQLRKLMD